jgi:hypothetical protein
MTNAALLDPLRGPWLKIARADALGAEFRAKRRQWSESRPYEVSSDPSPDGTSEIIKVRISKPYPDDQFCIVADIIHNIYTALDHLAFILAGKIAGCTSLKALRKCDFPVAPSKDQFEKQLLNGIKLGFFNDRIVEFFRELEPYQGGKHAALFRLSRLENVGKHRFVIGLLVSDSLAIYISGGIRSWVHVGTRPDDEVELGRFPRGSMVERIGIFPRMFLEGIDDVETHGTNAIGVYRKHVCDVLERAEECFFPSKDDRGLRT